MRDRDEEFYQYLHQGVRVSENFKKGEIIDPDPTVVRILWQGLVEPVLPAHSYNKRKSHEGRHFLFLPRHQVIMNDQFSDQLRNVQCHCIEKDCNCANKLVFFEIDNERLHELLTKARKEEISAMVAFLTMIDIFLKVSNKNLEFAASKVMI